MKYYVAEGGQYVGPFEVAELQARGINADTLVYNEMLGAWTKAGEVPELLPILAYAAPLPPSPAPSLAPAPAPQAYQQSYQQPYQQPAYQQPYAPQYAQPRPALQYGSTALIFGILEILFCCLPCGIVGVVFWSKANSCAQAGDAEGMEKNSKTANTWLWVGFGLGLVTIIAYVALIVTGVVAGTTYSSFY